jgi:uncharacterized protein (DUF488 family)
MRIVTIGVYGFSETAFFNALQQAGVDTFCDIRWRRGVRGADYAFANRSRLERRLAELGIRYHYARELAATPDLRKRQYDADKAEGTTKRKRLALGEAFIAGYRNETLSTFDTKKFLKQLGPEARTIALFCVEREPAACHRSLVAERLSHDLAEQVEITHLLP